MALRLRAGGRVAAVLAVVTLALCSPALAGASLVALWHMDEIAGTTAVDSSGTGNNGALSDIALGQIGLLGTGFGFDGVSSSIVVPDSPTLNPGSSNFSFGLSVNFAAVPPTDYDLLRKGLSTTTGGDYKVEILKKKSGTQAWAQCFFGGSSASKGIAYKVGLADARWHTITCTKTTSSIAITVDGVTTTKVIVIGAIFNSNPVWLGAKFKSDRPKDRYLGLMDEASIQIG